MQYPYAVISMAMGDQVEPAIISRHMTVRAADRAIARRQAPGCGTFDRLAEVAPDGSYVECVNGRWRPHVTDAGE